ncbi:hypothetical protein QBC36DRAFT_335523 [Triangularia setosa]|uniref:Uncharacterized protein n=1 Tax=Triangularia setosa TaxID=2587417 RepID=A0AAN6W1B2_9PEZI|nr:hypothetical protein QBC36DRAFT_335523 [Podospora setosa]
MLLDFLSMVYTGHNLTCKSHGTGHTGCSCHTAGMAQVPSLLPDHLPRTLLPLTHSFLGDWLRGGSVRVFFFFAGVLCLFFLKISFPVFCSLLTLVITPGGWLSIDFDPGLKPVGRGRAQGIYILLMVVVIRLLLPYKKNDEVEGRK